MAVKVGGKVLREFDGTVALPFGSEYTILLKNLSTQRASVKISIDGQDATEGVSLIVNAGESMELKRFLKNGNLNAGNAFKFIEKTAQIEAYRGNKAEDGLLTVTYEFERDFSSYQTYPYKGLRNYESPTWTSYDPYSTQEDFFFSQGSNKKRSIAKGTEIETLPGSNLRCYNASAVQTMYSATADNYANDGAMSLTASASASASMQNVSGITAPGSIIEQEFKMTTGFWGDGNKHTMTLKMVGAIKGQEVVKEAVIVKKLQRCQMCGTNTKQTAKFCHNCGASVQIV